MKYLVTFIAVFLICFTLHNIIYTEVEANIYKFNNNSVIFQDKYRGRYELEVDSTEYDYLKHNRSKTYIIRLYDDGDLKLLWD